MNNIVVNDHEWHKSYLHYTFSQYWEYMKCNLTYSQIDAVNTIDQDFEILYSYNGFLTEC